MSTNRPGAKGYAAGSGRPRTGPAPGSAAPDGRRQRADKVVFLAYAAIKSILSASAAQNYSLLGFLVVGIILIFVARFGLRSSFFQIRRESWQPEDAVDEA